MSGALATRAPHLDGSEPVGVWFDAAWAQYVQLMLNLDRDRLEALDNIWDELLSEDEPGQPTPENFGKSRRAQEGQAAMFAMLGGMPPGMGMDADSEMGAAESVGDPTSNSGG